MASKAGGGERPRASGEPASQPASRSFHDVLTDDGSTGDAGKRRSIFSVSTTSTPPNLSEERDVELADDRAGGGAPSPRAPAEPSSKKPPEHEGGAGPDPGHSEAPSFAELVQQVGQLARDNEDLKRRVDALEQPCLQRQVPLANSSASQVELVGTDMVCSMEYQFQPSVWDTAFFVGHPWLGPGGSFLLLVALAISVGCQLCFSYVVMENMTENDFVSEDARVGLSQWRQNAGHSVQNMGTVSRASLTARVCADPVDMSLEMSTRQQEVVDDIRSYLGASALNGQSLCALAVLLFVMHIMKDIGDTLLMVQGVYGHTEWGKKTLFKESTADHPPAGTSEVAKGRSEMHVHSTSSFRFVCVVLLGILRIGVAGFLCFVGIPFLVQTGSLEDLILNALALTCILEFDEVVYTVLVPTIAMKIISCTRPVRWESRRWHIAGADHLVLSRLVIVTVGILLIWTQMIVPFSNELRDVRDIICGAPVDVVYAVNPRSGQVEWAPSIQSGVAASSRPENEYKTDAVLEILNLSSLSNETALIYSVRSSLDRVAMLPTLGVGDPTLIDNDSCMDKLEHQWSVGPEAEFPRDIRYWRTRKILSSVVGLDLDFCKDVPLADCDDFFKPQVRTFCPRRCGCHDPRSGLFVASQNQGCPTSCLTAEHRHSLAALPCEDTPVEVLASDPAWRRLWDAETRYYDQVNFFHHNRGLFDLVGCDLIRAQPYNYGWCSDLGSPLGWTFSLRPWCPQACGCEGVGGGSCPGQCVNTNTSARAGTSEAALQEVAGVLNCPDVVHEEAICEVSAGAVRYEFPHAMAVTCCEVVQQLADEFFVVGSDVTNSFSAHRTTLCCANCTAKIFDSAYFKTSLNAVGVFEETWCFEE